MEKNLDPVYKTSRIRNTVPVVCLPGALHHQMHLLVQRQRNPMLIPDVSAEVAGSSPAYLAHEHAHLARIVREYAALRAGVAAAAPPPHQVAVPVEGEGEAVLVVQVVLQLGALKKDHLRAHFAPGAKENDRN